MMLLLSLHLMVNINMEGALQENPAASAHCAYQKQFEEKKCGTHALNHYAKVCNGKYNFNKIINK